jgi:hypothetical protein
MSAWVAIDFETANEFRGSPCAVALVAVRDGIVVDQLVTYVQPPPSRSSFSPFNMSIHGITPAMVADAPTWPEALAAILQFIDGRTLVARSTCCRRARPQALGPGRNAQWEATEGSGVPGHRPLHRAHCRARLPPALGVDRGSTTSAGSTWVAHSTARRDRDAWPPLVATPTITGEALASAHRRSLSCRLIRLGTGTVAEVCQRFWSRTVAAERVPSVSDLESV